MKNTWLFILQDHFYYIEHMFHTIGIMNCVVSFKVILM